MSEAHRVEVEILGQKYTIRSEADPKYVRDLAAYVEQRAKSGARPGVVGWCRRVRIVPNLPVMLDPLGGIASHNHFAGQETN